MTAYATTIEARAYYEARDFKASHIDDKALAALLLRASEMIDAACQFAGVRAQAEQRRSWPRDNITDETGHDVIGIPHQVSELTMALALMVAEDEKEAYRALGLARGITQERIGDIHLRYSGEGRHLPSFLRPLRAYLAGHHPIMITRS